MRWLPQIKHGHISWPLSNSAHARLHDLITRQEHLLSFWSTPGLLLDTDTGSSGGRTQDTAVITPFGLYEFTVMTFGFRNASQTFQRYTNSALGDLDFVFVYLDDILIASSSEEEHKQHLDLVLSRLNEHELQVNVEKCKFGVAELVFLGHLITSNGFKPNPDKVKVIQECPLSQTIQELRRFLGLVNSYRRLLANAADTQRPLNEFLKGIKKKDKRSVPWTEEAKTAFHKCKEDIVNLAFFALPNENAELRLKTDASDTK